jgi:hypothetical protein
MQVSASTYFFYGDKLQQIRTKINEIKLSTRMLESYIAEELRQSDMKISEAKIEKKFYLSKDYVALVQQYNTLLDKEGKLQALIRALEQRHSLLITCANLIKEELRKII